MDKAIFEILRAGTFNGKLGNARFARDDLATLSKMYNESIQRAPLVIGHPDDDKPEYGKVTKVYHHNDQLFAEAEISPDLVARIKKGEIGGISSAVYFSEHPENPIKGLGCYLKHVGFLERGKDEPAVQGMLDPQVSVLHLANLNTDNNIAFLSDGGFHVPEIGELNQRVLYFQNMLGVDYTTAFNIAGQ